MVASLQMNTVDPYFVSPLFITKENCWYPGINRTKEDLPILSCCVNDRSDSIRGRYKCSFLEVLLLALTSDPFLCYFALTYAFRVKSSLELSKYPGDNSYPRDSDGNSEDMIVLGNVDRGQAWLTLLEKRILSTNKKLDNYHSSAYLILRAMYSKSGNVKTILDEFDEGGESYVHPNINPNILLGKLMADITAYLLSVAPNARIVQLYVQNGFRVIVKRSVYCLHCKQSSVEYYHHSDAVKYTDALTDISLSETNPLFAPLTLDSTKQSIPLSELLNEHFKGKWKIAAQSECRTENCSHRTGFIERKQIVNLPSMLYVRIEDITKGGTISYARDNLTIGPTASGQYAKYELVSRIHWKKVIFSKTRKKIPYGVTATYENFVELYDGLQCKKYSFDVKADELHEPSCDDRSVTVESDAPSSTLVWRRVA